MTKPLGYFRRKKGAVRMSSPKWITGFLKQGLIGLTVLIGLFGLPVFGAQAADDAAPVRDAAHPYRIFMVLWRGETQSEVGFRDYLAEHNVPVTYTVRNVNQDPGKLAAIREEIRETKPDLVYTWGSTVTVGIAGVLDDTDPKNHVGDIPVLFTTVTDPVGADLVQSFAHPGRNVTGTSHMAPLDAQMKGMASYGPFHRIANIYNPAELNSASLALSVNKYCHDHGIEVVNAPIPLDAQGKPMASAIPDVIAQVATKNVDYIYLGPDSFIGSQAALFTDTAIKYHLKVFATTEQPLHNGHALFGLISPYYSLGRLTGSKARQILVDHKPASEVPVEVLGRFAYVVNMAVARQLGSYPPIFVIRFAEVLTQ